MDNSFKPELANEVKGLPCYIYSYQRDSGDGSTHTVYLFSKADYDFVRDDYDTWQPECHGGLDRHLTVTGSPEYEEAIANSVEIRTYTKIIEKAPGSAHLFFLHIGPIEDSKYPLTAVEKDISEEDNEEDDDSYHPHYIFNEEAFDEYCLRDLDPKIENTGAVKASEIKVSFGYVNTDLENYFKNLYCYCAVDKYSGRECVFFKVFEG